MKPKLTSKARPALKLKSDGGQYFTTPSKDLEFVNSGAAILNCVLGGGYPLGRIVNIVGDKSTGKTLLAIEACCNFLHKFPQGRPVYVEPEASFDKSYASALGMPVDRIEFPEEDISTIEELFDHMTKKLEAMSDDEPGLYIVDSLDALSDEAEMKRGIREGSYNMAKPKLLGQLFRRLIRIVKKKRVLVIIISQVRDNIGVTFGDRYTRSGGKALDFYSSQILWLAQTGLIKKMINKVTRSIGVNITAKCKKNKVGIQARECKMSIKFGYGVDDVSANVEFLKEVNMLKCLQSGLTPESCTRYINMFDSMEPDARVFQKQQLDKAVVAAWAQIERQFLPTQKKY